MIFLSFISQESLDFEFYRMEDTENQSIHTARHHASFGEGKRQYGMWHVACGMWHLACGMWHGMWHDFRNDIIMRNDVYVQ